MSNKMLPNKEMPLWLSSIQSSTDLDNVKIENLLEGSLYYPSGGRDGDPIKFLGGHIFSFVYSDNGVSIQQVENSINNQNRNFLGYHLEFKRDNPFLYESIWFILKRSDELNDDFGPDRLSLLYVHGDDFETFKNLYSKNKICPTIIALIKAGWMGSDNYDGDGKLATAVYKLGLPFYMLEVPNKSKKSFWGKHLVQLKYQKIDYDDFDLVLWGNQVVG
ncbi:hypothetical protein [uncultured Thiodictyon sp.]|uniref:hypothetical protein n=1 Tax=uncultured Thiodictyon sp. TaxID=1846217 RepID=UPI0025DE8D27|nr:hypothetical protein [uncultured Thiodictyon sp.]